MAQDMINITRCICYIVEYYIKLVLYCLGFFLGVNGIPTLFSMPLPGKHLSYIIKRLGLHVIITSIQIF